MEYSIFRDAINILSNLINEYPIIWYWRIEAYDIYGGINSENFVYQTNKSYFIAT